MRQEIPVPRIDSALSRCDEKACMQRRGSKTHTALIKLRSLGLHTQSGLSHGKHTHTQTREEGAHDTI